MSNPKFVYDGKTLSFAEALSSMERRKFSERDIVFSASGKAGSVFEHALDMIEIEIELFDDRAFYRALQAWWAWACQGNEYAFALDAADTINTTLNGTAAAGQKVIPLTSTVGIVAASRYRVRSADLTKEEIIQVDTISVGVSVTAVDNLIWGYASGDFFRSEDYFPKVISRDDDFPAVETDFGNFKFKHKMREVA